MADVSRSDAPKLSLGETWRRLNFEQRVAAVGAVLLVISTLGPFSFVEAAMILTAGGVLLLVRKRAEGKLFHVPFGDGSVIAAAGAWAGFLILVRFVDRPAGQSLLALVCAAAILLAGLLERAKHPPDDLPAGAAEPGTPPAPPPDPEERVAPAASREAAPAEAPPAPAEAPPADQATAETQALPAKVLPPATPPGRRASGEPREQPHLWDEPTD